MNDDMMKGGGVGGRGKGYNLKRLVLIRKTCIANVTAVLM